MKKYDLHVHSNYSACGSSNIKNILKVAKKRKLNGIALTDHNMIKGALKLKKLNKDKNFEVIVGEEVMTDNGEILAYYLNEEIKPGKYEEVMDKIREQDALTSVAHPYTFIRSITFKEILTRKLDGVEVFNGRELFPSASKKAEKLAKRINAARTAGSDAHFLFEIGKGQTHFEDDLKKAMLKRKTIPVGRYRPEVLGLGLSVILKNIIKRKK